MSHEKLWQAVYHYLQDESSEKSFPPVHCLQHNSGEKQVYKK